MMKLRRNWRILIGCGVLMLVTAGCFQDVRDAESQNVASQLNTPTSTPVTPTDIPELPTAFPTDTPTPTEEISLVSDLVGGTAVAQEGTPGDGLPIDTWALTATRIVAEITETSDAAFTQTAVSIFGATATPFPSLTPDPFLGATATPVFVGQPGGVCIHEVIAGENLFQLSIRYGVSVNDLAAASGITNINLILIGDKINIPACGTTGVFPPPTSTPTLLPVASGGTVIQTTPIVDSSGQVVQPGTGGRVHVVQQYETLFQISMQYGVSVASIANANGIANINIITMGDQLVIPAQ